MKITIKPKDIKVTKEIEKHIEEKADSLEKFINLSAGEKERKTLKEIIVEIERETKHHEKGPVFRAKMQMHLPGKFIYAESVSENLNLSINEVKDEIEKEIKKYKTRKISLRRKNERNLKEKIKLASAAKKEGL
ncbi:MAG: ribosome-associated translation inhibitor RaiA [Candidatus Paceibacterota bacterium]|nr:ribosome-associated translation inhibitor RaiA [Candidatus Paceibacterota bacterium]MDD3072769.1 ribosome-associated translation inhibitor RaiA [Candidatus Paceibacterota bacterium]MDD3729115.1 ribosome-associated translation inhibitor RaiA [Candidatus Paceibacterota bacterium]MDD4201233.1 ribosome-associated translation inhibitor RaiA [Candidatus Paceibacterota bacterium]MDD4467324.1 ribosome-associated translation inhibitor RaiA [Candidatus Paceibacterota bacterium]